MKNSYDLILLDAGFAICGIVEDYSLLRWTRRWFSCGEFALTLPPSARRTTTDAHYVYNPVNGETAIIECIKIIADESGARTLYMSGRLLEALLETRVIDGTENVSGLAELSAFALAEKYAMTGSRAIPLFAPGNLAGHTETASAQFLGVTLSDALYGLLSPLGLSPRLTYDYESGKIFFTVACGLDRTQSQIINSWAVFSAEFENIRSTDYTLDSGGYRNYFYIAGEIADDGSRTVAKLDLTGGLTDRREFFVDAHTLKRNFKDGMGVTHTATEVEYASMLRGRGLEVAAKYQKIERVECVADEGAPPVYSRDYDLGDLCDCTDTALGIEHTLRITEITELCEKGVRSVRLILSA